MNRINTTLLLLFCSVYCLAQQATIPVPKPFQLKWHQAEMGAVFHYDLHVFDGVRYGQGNNRINPIEDYNIFNPTELNTDQWVLAAKAAGCKFAVLTATHETGFGLWQSDVNPYCLKAVKWRDGKGISSVTLSTLAANTAYNRVSTSVSGGILFWAYITLRQKEKENLLTTGKHGTNDCVKRW